MHLPQIPKLYLSNFLTGLVFWYGIEKLFMTSIGIDAVGIAMASASYLAATLLLDIPMGMIADKWSRKGVLALSAIVLAISSWVLGTSHSLPQYMVGAALYGLYTASTNGIYQSIIYDSLHEFGQSKSYQRVMGRAYALFMFGALTANVASGFISHHSGYRAAYFWTLISCVVNFGLLLSVREPQYHKEENKQKMLHQIGSASKAIVEHVEIFPFVVATIALTAVTSFMLEFGLVYMARYAHDDRLVGILWAAYAGGLALGSLISHRWQRRMLLLVLLSTTPLVVAGLVDHPIGIVFFIAQHVFFIALQLQAQSRIQDNTPSNVRTSVLSVLSAASNVAAIGMNIGLGFVVRDFGIMWGVRCASVVGVLLLGYWLVARARRLVTV